MTTATNPVDDLTTVQFALLETLRRSKAERTGPSTPADVVRNLDALVAAGLASRRARGTNCATYTPVRAAVSS